jgi:hypothetical protein
MAQHTERLRPLVFTNPAGILIKGDQCNQNRPDLSIGKIRIYDEPTKLVLPIEKR